MKADTKIVRALVASLFGIVFGVVSAFADSATVTNEWFAEPTSPLSSSWQAKLNSQPADLSTCATLVNNKVEVDVDTEAGYSLTYAPAAPASGAQVVTAKLNFFAAYDFDALPASVGDAKAGVALVRDESVFKIAYYNGSAWVKSDAATLEATDAEVEVRISLTGTELKYEYKSAGAYITLGTVATANKVASAEFLGSGVVAKFDGLVEQEAAATVDGKPFASLEEALEYAIDEKKTLTVNADCVTTSGYELTAGTTVAFTEDGATITTAADADTAKAPVTAGQTLAIAKGVLLAGGPVFTGDSTKIVVGDGATLKLTDNLTLGETKLMLSALLGAGENATELILNTGANLDLNGFKILLENDGKVTSATKLDIAATFGDAPTGFKIEESGSGPYVYALVEDTPEPPPAPADEDWFDGKIGADWPAAEGMKGSWCENAATLATYVSEKSALEIDTGNDLLRFTAENAGDLTTGIATITTTVSFTAMDLASLPDVNDPSTLVVKGGLALVRDGENMAFYAVVKKTGEEANEWVKIDAFDALAVEETAVDVKIVMKQSSGKTLITYALGAVTSAEYEIVMPNAATTINAVSYRGCGEVKNLAGIYKQGEVLLDGVPYDTFQGAYEAATNGATIKLLKDVSWAPAPFAYGLKNVTIDANGKTLTVDSSAASIFKSIGYKYTYVGGQIKVEMPFSAGEGTEAEPWEVGSYDDLVYFRNGVNAGSYGVGGEFFKQTKNINFAAVNAAEPWVGIGNEASRFVGTYDGNGKTISNLVLTNSVDGEAAFFSTVSNATIKSLTFDGVSLDAGALANKADAAAVVCYSYGDLTMTDITVNGDTPFEAAGNVAGICVNARYGATFTRCVNNLPLIGHYIKLGGICTYATGGTAIFNSCTNTAAITAVGTCKNGANNAGCDGLGGIVGYAQSSVVLTFQNCANTGALTAVDADTTKAAAAIGSILGYAQSCSFSNSYGNTAQDSVPAVARGVVNAAGLNFAKVAGGVATMISSGELVPGTLDAPKSYKVMSQIATAGVTLVADQAITLDKTFNTAFTPTFTDLPGYHVEETAVSASVTTYARVQDTVTLRFAEGALEGKHIDASKTVVKQGAEVIEANPDGSYTLASNSTYTVTYTAMAGYVFPNGLATYTTAAAQATDAEITIDAGAIDPAHEVFTITFTPNATATYTVTTNGYTFTPAGDAIVLDENAAFTVTATPVEGFSFTQTPTDWEKSGGNLVLDTTATATKTIVIPTAEEPTTAGWFDGKIADGWPTAGDMKGSWCDNATSLATFGDGKLAVSADSEPLAFTPTDAGNLKTDILTIQSTMKFTAMDPDDLPYGAELDEDKIGLTLVDTGAGVALYAIKADGATNVWFDLEMTGITDETEFDVTSVIETSNGKGQVTYTINGADYGPYPILANADSTVTEVSYKGSGEVKTLVGTTEAAGAAMIDEEIYDSFDAAYAAATDGQTIKLLKSQVWNGAFAGYKNVTIDANGKVLTIGDAVNAYAAKGLVCSYENDTLTVKIPFDGTGAEETPWKIDSYENIVLFKNGVNAGTYGTNGEFFVQTADIDLAGKPAWDGIGIYTKAGQNKGDFGFAATYDGAGYKISNLTFPNKKYAALFAQVGQTNKVGVVKNLTVENATFTDMSASGEWGGAMIVGHLENGTISACCSAGTLGSEQYPLTHNASGILGRLGNGLVENCTNTAALFATGNGTKIGGIVNICQIDPNGKTGESTIRGCVNTGTLTFVAGTKNDGTGGILGYASNGAGVVIEDCVNTGVIASTLANDAKVGQVIGYISNNAVTAAGNAVNADQLALGGTATVDGLDFATVEGGIATLVSTNDFVAGNTYKVMSAVTNLTAELKLAEDETIAFDNALNTAFDAAGKIVAGDDTTCKIEVETSGTVTTFSCVEIKWATVIVAADDGVTVALTNNDVAVASGFKADVDSNEVVTVTYTLKDGYTLDESTPAASIPASVTLNEEKDYVIAITTKTSAVTIEVPTVEHATYIVQCISTDGVTTNDVTATKQIPYGWTARIVYTADTGYQLTSPSTFVIENVTSAGDVVFVAPTPSLKDFVFTVPVGDKVTAVVTNETRGGEALTDYTVKYFDIVKASYTAETGYTLVNGDDQTIQATNGAAFVEVTATANAYTLKYVANGGEGDDVTTNLTYDVEHTVIANPFTKQGYSFACWTNEAAEAAYQPGDKVTNLTATAGATVTFKAVWSEVWRTITMPAETTGYTYVISNETQSATLTEQPYRVLDGDVVTIYYTAAEGYVIDKTSAPLGAITADTVVSGEKLPTATAVYTLTVTPNANATAVIKIGGTEVELVGNTTNILNGTTVEIAATPDAENGYEYKSVEGWELDDGVAKTNFAIAAHTTVTIPQPTLMEALFTVPVGDHVTAVVTNVEGTVLTTNAVGQYSATWGALITATYTADEGYTPSKTEQTATVTNGYAFATVTTSADLFTITYKNADGSGFTDFIDGYEAPTTFTVAEPATLPTAANIDQENFLFNAWTNESGKVTSTAGIIGDLTVYADITKLWSVKLPEVANATVKAYTNDTVEVTGKVVDGATVKFVATADEGYVLVGQTVFTTTATGNDTTVDVGGLVARKIVTYTFTGENVELAVATNSAPVTLDEEGKATLIEASTLTVTATPNEGYYYETAPDGWTLAAGVISTNGVVLATDETIAAPAPVLTNFTFTVPVGEHVTAVVTNETRGGEVLTDYTVKYFDIVKASYTADAGYTLVNGDDQTIQATNGAAFVEVTATANAYTVKYVDGAGAEAVSNATYDVEFAISENVFAKTGYHFTGWTNETDNVGYQPNEIVSNLTTSGEYLLKAVWAANEYEVRYNANGGEGDEFCATNTYDTAFTAAATNGFKKMGYTFANWTNDTYSIAAGVETNVNLSTGEGVTLYAAWTPNAYTLTYKSGEGEGEDIVSNLVYDVEYTAAENTFTKTGYSFVYWTNDVHGVIVEGASISNLTDEPNGNVDFTAVYTANVYQITFDSKGGSPVEPIVASCDEAVEEPEAPTYDGYTFAGWFTNNAEEAYVFTTMPAGGLELFAKWTTNAYTITYKLNDAPFNDPFNEWKSGYMAPTAFTTVDPATIPTVANVVQTNYAFYGWTTNGADFTSATTAGIFTNLTLTAKVTKLWTITAAQIDNATCVIKTNGLEAVAGEDGIYRALQGAPVSVVYTAKDGYKFQDGTKEIVKEFTATENMEVKVEDVLPSIKYFTITLPNRGEYDNINTTVTTNDNTAVGENGVYEVFSNDTFKVAFEKAADDYELEGGINPNEFTVVSNVTIATEDIPVAWKLFTITMPGIPEGLVYTVTNELKGTIVETNGYIAAGETYQVRTNTYTRFTFETIKGYKFIGEHDDVVIANIDRDQSIEVPEIDSTFTLTISNSTYMTFAVTNDTAEVELTLDADGNWMCNIDGNQTYDLYVTPGADWQFSGWSNPKTISGFSGDVVIGPADLPKPLPVVAEYTVGGGTLQKTWNATNVVALLATEMAQKLDVKFVKASADITTLPAEFAYEFEKDATIVVTPATAGELPTVEITSGELVVKADVEAEKNIVINGNVNFEGTAIKSGNRDTFVTVNGNFTCGSFTNGTEGAEGVAALVVTGTIDCTGAITIIPGSIISAKASNYAAFMETLPEYAISVIGPDADGFWTYSATQVGKLIFEDEWGNPIVVPGDSVEALEQYIIEQSLLDPDYEALLVCNEEVTLNGEGGKYVFPAGAMLQFDGADWLINLAEGTTLVSDKMNIENDKTITVEGGTVAFTGETEIKVSKDADHPTIVDLTASAVDIWAEIFVGTDTGAGWAELWLGDDVTFNGGKTIVLLEEGVVVSYRQLVKDGLAEGREIVTKVTGCTVFEEYDPDRDYYIYSVVGEKVQELLPFEETTVTADSREAAQDIADTFVVKSDELEVNTFLYQNGKVAEYQSLFKFTATASGVDGVFTVKAAFAPEVLASISNEVNSAAAKIMNDFRYQRSGEINIATKPGIWYGVRAGDTIDELKAVDVKWMLGTGGEVSLKWNVKDGSKQAYYFVEAVTKRPGGSHL